MLMYERNLGLLLMAKLNSFRHIGRLTVNIRYLAALFLEVKFWKLKS
jgi:hypothetical protein